MRKQGLRQQPPDPGQVMRIHTIFVETFRQSKNTTVFTGRYYYNLKKCRWLIEKRLRIEEL
jgi:hypothetical protein